MVLSDPLDAMDYYDRDAAGFAARYDSVTFDAVHPLLSRYLPAGGQALDIGAGSGRDARALAAHGLHVTAVEPSSGLRDIGQKRDPAIRWVDDRLPFLASFAKAADKYDVILCSAVLMLVAPSDLGPSFGTMARLLAPGGRLAVNVRRPMPSEPLNLFTAHSDAAIMAAAGAADLVCHDRIEIDDALGRRSYRWSNFIFVHAC